MRVSFVTSQPPTAWNLSQPDEYGFYANVNPQVDHPRWSQKRERVIGAGIFAPKKETRMFNGYTDQVAGLYDWVGMSTSAGYQLMDRLQVIASRTLVDVQPMYAGGANEYGYDVVEFDPDTGAVVSKPASKPRLVGLRVEQVLKDGHTPSRTVFSVRQRLGCWWIAF